MKETGRPRVLVIVPAHNEETVIARGVLALLKPSSVDVRVLVVANACSDLTAERVQAITDERAQVLALTQGGKAHAIRAGLESYKEEDVVAVVDADVVLSENVLLGLAAALSPAEPLIAAPHLNLVTDECSALVRLNYRHWQREPHLGPGDIGARGVYAVNRAGLERLSAMPEILADDGWARAIFAPHERVVSDGTSTVFPARTWRAQVRRRARVLAGNRELREVLPMSQRPATRPGTSKIPQRTFASRIREDGFLSAGAHYAIDLPARVLHAYRRFRRAEVSWGTDVSTRQ